MNRKEYIEAIQAAGHLLLLDDDGGVDMWAMSYEFHNGPMCELCHKSWCANCRDTINPCAEVIESTCEVIKEESTPPLLPSNVELTGLAPEKGNQHDKGR